MLSYSKIINFMAFLALVFMLGCGGESVEKGEELFTCDAPLIVNPTGNACIEPEPIECPAPTIPNEFNDACEVGFDPNLPMPSVIPTEFQTVLYYNRASKGATNEAGDPAYSEYLLHTWNNDDCKVYAPPYDDSDWNSTNKPDGIDPNYGAYWVIPLLETYSECSEFANYIIHKGDDKETNDITMVLDQDDPVFTRMNFFITGQPLAFEYPVMTLGPQAIDIEGAAAHWLDANTFVWNGADGSTDVRLHHSSTAGIEADLEGQINGTAVSLTAASQTEAQQTMYPLTKDWPAYTIDSTAEEVKAILKGQLVVAAYDDEGNATIATYVQAAKVLDDLYTKGDADADEATLGVVYEGDAITANLWAPTAQNVDLQVFDAGKNLVSTETMTEDPATGIWSFEGTSSLDRQFYRYEVTVYHSQNKAIETIWSTDPYSVSLSTNGRYSQFVNLTDADLKPEGWDGHTVPSIENPEDAVIYEGHIRDFSILDESTSEANRGKYMAFTEAGSVPMTHLSELVASGLTHFHILPAFDVASINENEAETVNLTDTVADLCLINDSSPVCGVENDSDTLLSVLESYGPGEDAQALTESMRGLDSFNWGYDPHHYNVPEGSYSSNPDGVTRILEMRSMNKALHDAGLRVVLDVVYNHTSSSGLWDTSVLDKIVPGYYYRKNLETGNIETDNAGQDIELENRMMDKFMVDSLLQWTTQYRFDGFRFDIMAQGTVEQMLAAREAVQAVDPDNYFYGEGWFKSNNGREDTQAYQHNLAGSEIGTFNDRLRDKVRDASLFSGDNNNISHQDIVKLGMAGTLADYVLKGSSGAELNGSSYNPSAYAKDPADVINYVSKHDNESLWDILQYGFPFEMSLEDRVRSATISTSIPLMSQGIPFLQLGGEMLRSKSMDRNSYDSGDWFNRIDFTQASNNWNVGLPNARDNQGNWYTDPENPENLSISALSASPLTQAVDSDIAFTSNVFKEFLRIRNASGLFRLTTADDIIARVGFHNLGQAQQQGVIVMSIDDGIGLPDLDLNYDAIVVMVNGTDQERTHTVKTAAGFELHPTQMSSFDSTVQTSSFEENVDDGEGTFTVPARTMAVFVKPQGAEQGEGLKSYATSGAPDIPPYGDEVVYLRGGMNGWGDGSPFEYKGDGIYEVLVDLPVSTLYEFKIGSFPEWGAIDFGSNIGLVTQDENKTLARGAGNLNFTTAVAEVGAAPEDLVTYSFRLNASVTEAPVLNVSQAVVVYIRGDMNSWGVDPNFAMTYIGNDQFKLVHTFDAAVTQSFKVADAGWGAVNWGPFDDNDETVNQGAAKLLRHNTSGNLRMDFEAATYTFIFDESDPSARVITVYENSLLQFGGATIYLKGEMNGWSNDDPMTFNWQTKIHSIDKVLTTNSYLFKIAGENWGALDFGAVGGDENIILGTDKILSGGANIVLDIVVDGVYRFEVSGTVNNPPTVNVTQQ